MKNRVILLAASALVIIAGYGLEHALPTSFFSSVAVAASPTKAVVEAWIKTLEKKATPTSAPEDLYEIKHTDPYNYLIKGGGEQIWADGIRSSDASVLDAKYVGNAARSPYIPDSGCPAFISKKIDAKTDDEFRRYAAVINDATTPVDKMEVITNNKEAAAYFKCFLTKHNISGQVVVKD
jgi:hypothetical protein